ncbi:methyl-accepting chemotaxis protein [Magnetococcales bacterium HHB-1]
MRTELWNLTIVQKIILGFFIPFCLIIGLAVFIFIVEKEVDEDLQHAQKSQLESALLALSMKIHVVQVQQWLTDISATRAQDGLNDGFDEAEKHYQEFLKDLAKISALPLNRTDVAFQQRMEDLKIRFDNYYRVGKVMAQAYIDGGPSAGNKTMASFDTQAEALSELLTPFVEHQTVAIHSALDVVAQELSGLRRHTIVIAAVALIFLLIVGYLITRSITLTTHALANRTQDLSDGESDLTFRIPIQNQDEMGVVARNVNRFMDKLLTILWQVNYQVLTIGAIAGEFDKTKNRMQSGADELQKQSEIAQKQVSALTHELTVIHQSVQGTHSETKNMASAAEELDHNMTTMAAATEQASLNVHTVAAAAEQMTSNITGVNQSLEQVSDSVKMVSDEVDGLVSSLQTIQQQCEQATTQASVTDQRASEAREVMTRLDDSAQEIDKAVDLINTIANQTNMLALNASIEAAGAGEAGKGFSVVANEVKELANQTAEATKLIRTKVSEMVANTSNASEATQEISKQANGINQVNQEISESVDAQMAAVMQISQSMNDVKTATQTVSQNSLELSHAAEEVARASGEADLGVQEIARGNHMVQSIGVKVAKAAEQVNAQAESIQAATQQANNFSSRVVDEMNMALVAARRMTTGINLSFLELVDSLNDAKRNLRQTIGRFVIGPEPFDVEHLMSDYYQFLFILERSMDRCETEQQIDNIVLPTLDQSHFMKWWEQEGGQERFSEFGGDMCVSVHRILHEEAKKALNRAKACHTEEERGNLMASLNIFGRELRPKFFQSLQELYTNAACNTLNNR